MKDFFAGVTGHWPADTGHYHWLVLLDQEVVRRKLAAPYWDLVDRPGLAPVRPRWAHITIQHLAPARSIADGEIREIIRLVRECCAQIGPFQVITGPPRIDAAAVVCPVTPAAPLTRLWQVTTSAGKRVTGVRYPVRPDPYKPHLTLAYAHADVDDGPVRAWLDSHRPGPAELQVAELWLVVQQHDRREITWRLVEQVPLRGR